MPSTIPNIRVNIVVPMPSLAADSSHTKSDCVNQVAAAAGQQLRQAVTVVEAWDHSTNTALDYTNSSYPLYDSSLSLTCECATDYGAMIRSLVATVASLERRVDGAMGDSLAWKKPLICSAATQILMVWLWKASLNYMGTTRWFVNSSDVHLGELVALLEGGTDDTLYAMRRTLDTILTKRKVSSHPAPLAALDFEVTELLEWITPGHARFTPGLKNACLWESRILQAYAHIKRLFPDRFR